MSFPDWKVEQLRPARFEVPILDPVPPPAGKPSRETSGGPYCGVYCAYSALRMLGSDVEFEELLETRYVGSWAGSSLVELKQAVIDQGAYAEPMHGLTASALRASSHPIILHVRRPGHGTTYAHWVLFLGVEGDKARIVDPPNSVQLLPFSELLALWDGAGLVMSKEPITTTQIQAGAWVEQIVLLLLVGAVLGIARAIQHRYSVKGRWLWPFLGLPAAALAGAYHLIHDDGFFHNRVAVAQVAGRYFKPALPALSVDEVAAILNQPDVTVIDARFPEDYRRGHVKGAINLPVYSGLVERAELLAAVPESHRVILYCQSEACGWGEAIASDLVLRGYRNVYLFPGGWRQWVQHERSKRQD